ncbi:MAG: radical SAM/Cys-rich protein [Halieaceae bacterium]|jgi:radical SAM/Cys-rich protein
MLDTRPLLLATDFPQIYRSPLATLQVNLGYLCNMSCVHCHVNAGPTRTELMTRAVIDTVLAVVDRFDIKTLDLTGGAPELNPNFRYLVKAASDRGVEVIDRCNLTVLLEPGQEDLADFLVEQKVTITASLPCYLEENVEKQRGKGAYSDSIQVLQMLNALGYGRDPALQLNLVYNPIGPVLPPSQDSLKVDYDRELGERFGIVFNELYTITNMPISRFGAVLLAKNQFTSYMSLLRDSYSDANLDGVMCKSLVSVDWQGDLYDCDFNQMLETPMQLPSRPRAQLSDLLQVDDLADLPISVGEHCFGCTAGHGSSCGGALDDSLNN